MALISGGVLWLILDLVSPGLLPRVAGSTMFSALAMMAGVVLLWINERSRQRRQWKGLKTRKYYD